MYKILVVDDNELQKGFLYNQLKKIGYEVTLTTGASAMNKAVQIIPDMVLLSIEMSGINGFEILKSLRSYSQFKTTIVIMISDNADTSIVINSFLKGANDFVVKPFEIGVMLGKIVGWQNTEIENQWSGLSSEQSSVLQLLKVLMDEAFDKSKNSSPLSIKPIRNACEMLYLTIEHQGADAVIKAVEGYNSTMFLHSLMMCIYIMLFARYKKYDKDDVVDMAVGGLLHDIGSAKIPNSILFKPGRLDIKEYTEIKSHVQLGIEILDNTPDMPQVVKNICRHHHEKMDGSGYEGISGDSISMEGRLAAIVEIYCALTAKTVYKETSTSADALSIMMTLDEQYDPNLLVEFKEAVMNKFILSRPEAALHGELDPTLLEDFRSAVMKVNIA